MFSLDPYRGELKDKDGWVAPNGDFHQCPYEYHWRFADNLCKKFKYRLEARFFLNLDAEYTLELNGWVKISLGRVHYHSERSLTNKQTFFLIISWPTEICRSMTGCSPAGTRHKKSPLLLAAPPKGAF